MRVSITYSIAVFLVLLVALEGASKKNLEKKPNSNEEEEIEIVPSEETEMNTENPKVEENGFDHIPVPHRLQNNNNNLPLHMNQQEQEKAIEFAVYWFYGYNPNNQRRDGDPDLPPYQYKKKSS